MSKELMRIDIRDIAKMNLEPGDILVIFLKIRISADEHKAMRDALNEIFTKNQVLICDGEIKDIKIIKSELEDSHLTKGGKMKITRRAKPMEYEYSFAPCCPQARMTFHVD